MITSSTNTQQAKRGSSLAFGGLGVVGGALLARRVLRRAGGGLSFLGEYLYAGLLCVRNVTGSSLNTVFLIKGLQ